MHHKFLTRKPDPADLPFDPERALRLCKIRKKSRHYERWKKEIFGLAERHRELLELRYRMVILEVDEVDRQAATVRLEGGSVLEGANVARKLETAPEVGFWMLSVGDPIDHLTHELMSREPDTAFLLDAVASMYVIALQERVQEEIAAHATERGLHMRPRFSPGYHGWPLEQQAVLHQLLQAHEIGIELTDGMLMMPRKSLSGMNPLSREPSDHTGLLTHFDGG